MKLGLPLAGNPVVLGLPRGGVVVAAEVARAGSASLDVIIVRKLGVPFEPELAFGAIGEGGAQFYDSEIVRQASLDATTMAAVEARERQELARRAAAYRAVCPRIPIDGRRVIVVDDGVATGSTARVACQVASAQGAAHVVLAAPVAPPASRASLAEVADEIVFVSTPAHLDAIGRWYADFSPTPEAVVVELLRQAARSKGAE